VQGKRERPLVCRKKGNGEEVFYTITYVSSLISTAWRPRGATDQRMASVATAGICGRSRGISEFFFGTGAVALAASASRTANVTPTRQSRAL